MQLDLRYPFLTSGIPKRNARRRDLYMAVSMSVDVPEVSERETEIAFTTAERCRLDFQQNRYEDGVYAQGGYRVLRKDGGISLRTYDGNLYRRIGTVEEINEGNGWGLKRAFPHSIGTSQLEFGAEISTATTGTTNAMTAALVRQFDWELERSSVSSGRVVNAWPMTLGDTTRHGTRERMDFRVAMPDIAEIDEAMSARSYRMIDTQTKRLLAIGGEIWMTCRPPCFVVQLEEVGAYLGTLSMAHAHEGFDSTLSRRYFAIDDYAGAREYFELCARKPKHESGDYHFVEMLPEFRIVDPAYMEYDADSDELAKIGYALASECSRYQARTAKWLEGNKQDSLEAAMREVGETNYVTGEFGNVTPFVEDLISAWEDFGRPSTFCEVGPKPARKRYGDMMIRQAHKLLDNAPIDLGSDQSFAFGGKPRP